ncbi:hypothetical protein IE53DRAFT_299221, partial [Violaceomyces palustris]
SGSTTSINDTQILQYALTLEHLENAFYNQSISQFGEDAFVQAGLNASSRNQLYSIGQDEAKHVAFLTQALGSDAVQPCTYNFSSVTDVQTFLATARVLEGVGVSAYLGAAGAITNKAYLGAAGSILTVESRHATYINSVVQPDGNVVPSSFDTPLNFNEVYSLAAPFISECPSNQTLPFKAFPSATITAAEGSITPGAQVTTSSSSSSSNSTSTSPNTTYLALVQGPLEPYFVELPEDGQVTLPANLTGGQMYAIVTSSNETISDDNTIAGPAVAFVDVPLPTAPNATTTDNITTTTTTLSSSSVTPSGTTSETLSALASTAASSTATGSSGDGVEPPISLSSEAATMTASGLGPVETGASSA